MTLDASPQETAPANASSSKLCSIEGCGTPVLARGWCTKHYRRWQAHGDPLGSAPKREKQVVCCAVEGCGKPVRSRGYCSPHYQQWRLHGDAYREVSRTSAAGMQQFRDGLYEIVEEGRPMTVRQVFYQATVRSIVEKTEAGYHKVQINLVRMRKDDDLPYDWLVDTGRARRAPYTFDSVQEALEDTAETYRKALWNDIDAYVEIWLEKDALAGVIEPVTDERDVSLMSTRGYASLSFLSAAAKTISDIDKPVFIYHLGDFDPSGVNAGENIEETLRELALDADITFERLAVNKAQIEEWSLPSRPTKQSDPRAASFGDDESVELDAIAPDDLRDLVRKAIERHMPPEQFKMLKATERRESRIIKLLVELVEEQDLADEIEDEDEDEGED